MQGTATGRWIRARTPDPPVSGASALTSFLFPVKASSSRAQHGVPSWDTGSGETRLHLITCMGGARRYVIPSRQQSRLTGSNDRRQGRGGGTPGPEGGTAYSRLGQTGRQRSKAEEPYRDLELLGNPANSPPASGSGSVYRSMCRCPASCFPKLSSLRIEAWHKFGGQVVSPNAPN